MSAAAWCAATFAAALGAGCATVSTPDFDLTSDCRLRSMPWSERRAPAPGFGFGYGVIGGSRLDSADASPGGRESARSEGGDGRRREPGYGGVGFGFDLGGLRSGGEPPDLVPQWLEDGPRFPATYSNSCIPLRCFVKGGWPLVIDYTADGASLSTIELHVPGREATVISLDNRRGRHLLKFELPQALGADTLPAMMLVRSVRDAPGPSAPGYLQIHGLGAGPRAVGSVAIERVVFQPPLVDRSEGQQARYSFRSASDFNRVAVDVMRVDNVAGQLRVGLAREFRFDGGIDRGTVFGLAPPRFWDGTDANNRPSFGTHLLQVRAWMSVREDANWVTAWSEMPVRVTE